MFISICLEASPIVVFLPKIVEELKVLDVMIQAFLGSCNRYVGISKPGTNVPIFASPEAFIIATNLV
jgi:hypothetical protein